MASGVSPPGSRSSSTAQPPVVRCSPARASHSPAIVDHTSLMPKLSATVALHVRSICSRTALSPAPGSPAVTM
jgi:hypothetical protein